MLYPRARRSDLPLRENRAKAARRRTAAADRTRRRPGRRSPRWARRRRRSPWPPGGTAAEGARMRAQGLPLLGGPAFRRRRRRRHRLHATFPRARIASHRPVVSTALATRAPGAARDATARASADNEGDREDQETQTRIQSGDSVITGKGSTTCVDPALGCPATGGQLCGPGGSGYLDFWGSQIHRP